jgi:hypothetical protein
MTGSAEPAGAPAAPYAELSAQAHDMTDIIVQPFGDVARHITRRFIGRFTIHRPDGSESTEECMHVRSGIGVVRLFPHQTVDEALACARILLADRYDGIEIREPSAAGPQ